MRVRLLVLAALCACSSCSVVPSDESHRELHAFAGSGDRLATIDYVEGGGAAGYVGYSVRVAVRGHEWRTVAFVRAHDVAIAWDGPELTLSGTFDEWDRTQNERSIHAADGDGVHVRMRSDH